MRSKSPIRVTPRDLEILDALGSYRFLTVPQIAALYFGSPSTAEGRLRQLHDAELVVRVFMPVRPYDKTATTIYALGAKGAALLADRHDGIRPPSLAPADRRSALFLDHTLRRNDVRVCLELLDRDLVGFHLLTWKQAPEDVRGAAMVRGKGRELVRVPVVPDGFFAFRYRGEVTSYCLETDMGTVSPERMELRYLAYQGWWRWGGAAAKLGSAPLRVLTMAPTPSRIERLRSLARKARPPNARGTGLFWFALLSQANILDPNRLLNTGWLTAACHPGDHRPLVELTNQV